MTFKQFIIINLLSYRIHLQGVKKYVKLSMVMKRAIKYLLMLSMLWRDCLLEAY